MKSLSSGLAGRRALGKLPTLKVPRGVNNAFGLAPHEETKRFQPNLLSSDSEK